MSRIVNSNRNTAIQSLNHAIKRISKKLLEQIFNDVDEYEPIVGPILPRSNDGDSTKLK